VSVWGAMPRGVRPCRGPRRAGGARVFFCLFDSGGLGLFVFLFFFWGGGICCWISVYCCSCLFFFVWGVSFFWGAFLFVCSFVLWVPRPTAGGRGRGAPKPPHAMPQVADPACRVSDAWNTVCNACPERIHNNKKNNKPNTKNTKHPQTNHKKHTQNKKETQDKHKHTKTPTKFRNPSPKQQNTQKTIPEHAQTKHKQTQTTTEIHKRTQNTHNNKYTKNITNTKPKTFKNTARKYTNTQKHKGIKKHGNTGNTKNIKHTETQAHTQHTKTHKTKTKAKNTQIIHEHIQTTINTTKHTIMQKQTKQNTQSHYYEETPKHKKTYHKTRNITKLAQQKNNKNTSNTSTTKHKQITQNT